MPTDQTGKKSSFRIYITDISLLITYQIVFSWAKSFHSEKAIRRLIPVYTFLINNFRHWWKSYTKLRSDNVDNKIGLA